MMYIISILIIILTFSILKDTHVKVYYAYCSGKVELKKEYDFVLSVWKALIVVILGFIPTVNIVLFSVFIIFYVVHAEWSLEGRGGYVFSLRGDNVITKCLLYIKTILCKEI